MSRNFHTLHVHLGAPEQAAVLRDGVIDALRDHLKAEGLEPVRSAAGADRVVRVSRPRAGWITITDDGYAIEALAKHVARATGLPALEAYCEASAIVWLGLYHRGRVVGGWGVEKLPPVRAVNALLAVGNAAELADAWEDAQRQVFPETALAVAAERFGLDVARVFDESEPRGTTLALRRKRAAWTPVLAKGPPRFEVGIGSNQAHGGSHLVFVNRTIELSPSARSTGGAGSGLTVTFGGDVIERGLLVPERVTVESVGEGTGTLRVGVGAGSGDPIAEGTLALAVMFEPFRPRDAADADDHALFGMHQMVRRFVTITLGASLGAAWAWARSAIERWCLATGAEGQLARTLADEAMRDGLGLRVWPAFAVQPLSLSQGALPPPGAGSKFRHLHPWFRGPDPETAERLTEKRSASQRAAGAMALRAGHQGHRVGAGDAREQRGRALSRLARRADPRARSRRRVARAGAPRARRIGRSSPGTWRPARWARRCA